jgi:hypothetical protein
MRAPKPQMSVDCDLCGDDIIEHRRRGDALFRELVRRGAVRTEKLRVPEPDSPASWVHDGPIFWGVVTLGFVALSLIRLLIRLLLA